MKIVIGIIVVLLIIGYFSGNRTYTDDEIAEKFRKKIMTDKRFR